MGPNVSPNEIGVGLYRGKKINLGEYFGNPFNPHQQIILPGGKGYLFLMGDFIESLVNEKSSSLLFFFFKNLGAPRGNTRTKNFFFKFFPMFFKNLVISPPYL